MLAPYDTVLIGLGESIKTLQTVESIYRRFIELGVDRSTFVLAIGGGIVTDVAGFAASTYMRGIGFGSSRRPCWGRSMPAWAAKTA